MSAFRRMFAFGLVCLAASSAAAQASDQLVAARVLGPRWKQMARASGRIFAGTVLSVEQQLPIKGQPLPLVLSKFRVNRGIVGVHDGEVISIREWAGSWSSHRALRTGQRMLIFLYPPSRLGLTSPVGGHAGQVMLDSRGEIAAASAWLDPVLTREEQTLPSESAGFAVSPSRVNPCPAQDPILAQYGSVAPRPCVAGTRTLRKQKIAARHISVLAHVERAIRSARQNLPARNKE